MGHANSRAWHVWCGTPLGSTLQKLKPGEAGFMNAIVGSTAFSFAFYNHIRSQEQAVIEKQREAWTDHVCRVSDLVMDTDPIALIAEIEDYAATLVMAASSAGIHDPTRSELADEWLRRRNRPTLDPHRRQEGFQHAGDIDIVRLRLRRMWKAVQHLHEDPNHIAADGKFLGGSRSAENLGISDPATKEELPRRPGGANSGGRDMCWGADYPLEGELDLSIVEGSLLMLEPLDKAICDLHPGCNWDTDKCKRPYAVYQFMREQWHISPDWPGEALVHKPTRHPFKDTLPASRVAKELHRNAEITNGRIHSRTSVVDPSMKKDLGFFDKDKE